MTAGALLRVFANGGVISPADLLSVMEASEAAGNAFLMFSSRQDILFPASGRGHKAAQGVLSDAGLPFAPTSLPRLNAPFEPRNIGSSYASVNVMETTWWLTEDVLQYTIANFEEQPRLKVNVVDPLQSLVPLFGGHLHFVASRREQYWHLYVRAGDRSEWVERCPGLFHGDDLARAMRCIEECLRAAPATPLDEVLQRVRAEVGVTDEAEVKDLRLPNPFFPYYEGLNAMLNNQYWLGLYWRNNRFDIPFLRAACELCQDTKVGKICLTPWKSFIIKGIRSEDRGRWEKLMGSFGINMRHSSLELNWHIPLLDDEALELKNDLVRELTMQDISTLGLTFTVKSPDPAILFTSVVVERERVRPGEAARYSIRYARDFDPNRLEYLTFARAVSRKALPGRLIELSKAYSSRMDAEPAPVVEVPPREVTKSKPGVASTTRHQCGACLSVYDPAFGDPDAAIEPGVPFADLPEGYECPVCGGSVMGYRPFEGAAGVKAAT